jgi:hypothetical protein
MRQASDADIVRALGVLLSLAVLGVWRLLIG